MVSIVITSFAAEKVVTFSVENMTCMSCPYQVKKSLKKVDGIINASASMDTQQAVVTFTDPQVASVGLTQAQAKGRAYSENVRIGFRTRSPSLGGA